MHRVFLKVRIFFSILLMSTLALPVLAVESDPFPEITLPVHPKAINPTVKINSPFNGAKATFYTVKMSFPAKDLTDFYDSQLKKLGYEPLSVKEGGTFQWMNFNNKSGLWEKTTSVPARYTAAWANKQKTVKIWLYIAYKYDGANKEWNKTPFVSINMAKPSDAKNTK